LLSVSLPPCRRYRGAGITQTKIMTVIAQEFIRRFLQQHVLPAGVHKVRYYGLWSFSNRKHLRKMQQILTQPGNNQQVRLEEDMDVEVPPTVRSQTMPLLPKGHTHLDRAPIPPRESTTMRQLTLIS